MQLILAQVGPSVIAQILNLLFIACLIAIPILLITYFAKFMKSSLSNQQQIIRKLDDIHAALREK